MFTSASQTRALALLSFSSLVLSIAPPQIPLRTSNEVSNNNATAELFPPPSRTDDALVLEKCSPTEPSNTFSLVPKACPSGGYHPSRNLRINTAPTCPNGEFPVLLYYPRRGCTGKPTYHNDRKGHDIPINECLFEESTNEWSLIFRCGVWATLIEGADAHINAIPPPSSPQEGFRVPIIPATAKTPARGSVITHLSPTCNDQRPASYQQMELYVDTCLRTLGLGLQIMRPAICADGTRTKLARFPDQIVD